MFAENTEKIPYLSLKPIIINISDLLLEEVILIFYLSCHSHLISQDIEEVTRKRMQALSDKLEAKYHEESERQEVKVLTESFFQQQVETILERNRTKNFFLS